MTIADVEGAFLQGDEYSRKGGSIYTTVPKEGFPGVPAGSIFELTKCVYGLMDAPLRWMLVSRAIAEGDWIRSLIVGSRFEKYDLQNDSHWKEQIKMIVCVDNKPIYDYVHGKGIVVRDKRLAIDMLLVRKDIRKENTSLYWIDTRQMLSDCLTKLDVNCDFLRFVLRCGNFILVEEKDSLKWRLEESNTRKRVKHMKGQLEC